MVAAYAGAVLITVPGLKNFGCCLIVPATVAGAMYFYKRLNPGFLTFSLKDAMKFSLLTGSLVAITRSLIDIVLSFIFRSNDFTVTLPEMEKVLRDMALGNTVEEAIKLLRVMASDIENSGFSFLYSFFSISGNLILDIIFAIPGGLFAKNFLNKKQDFGL